MSAVQKSETSWTLKNYFPTTLPTPPPFSTWLTVINQALQLPVKIRGSGRRHLFAQGCHLTTFSTFHLLQWGTISFLWLAIVNPKRQIQETPISNLVPDGTAVSWSHLGPHSWHLWNDASGSPQPNPHWKSFTKDHNHCPCILLKIPCPAPPPWNQAIGHHLWRAPSLEIGEKWEVPTHVKREEDDLLAKPSALLWTREPHQQMVFFSLGSGLWSRCKGLGAASDTHASVTTRPKNATQRQFWCSIWVLNFSEACELGFTVSFSWKLP